LPTRKDRNLINLIIVTVHSRKSDATSLLQLQHECPNFAVHHALAGASELLQSTAPHEKSIGSIHQAREMSESQSLARCTSTHKDNKKNKIVRIHDYSP